MSAPRSKFIAMTRFCDLNLRVKANTTSKTNRYIKILPCPEKLHDLRLRNATVLKSEASLGSS